MEMKYILQYILSVYKPMYTGITGQYIILFTMAKKETWTPIETLSMNSSVVKGCDEWYSELKSRLKKKSSSNICWGENFRKSGKCNTYLVLYLYTLYVNLQFCSCCHKSSQSEKKWKWLSSR